MIKPDGRANRARRRFAAGRTTIGARLHTARITSGQTQERIARAMGVSLRTLQRWETGDAEPSISEWIALGRVLGEI